MSLPRFRANAYTECTRSYGIQHQTYAKTSYVSRHQISEKDPVSGVLSSRNWEKGRYVNGYTHPNPSQNLILERDRAERRQLCNGLCLIESTFRRRPLTQTRRLSQNYFWFSPLFRDIRIRYCLDTLLRHLKHSLYLR